MSAQLVRLAAAVLTSEKGRKTVGWVLAAILSPVILLVAFLCCVGSGTAEHNGAVISAAFYGTELSESVPTEYRAQLTQMRGSFAHLDAAVAEVNQKAEGNSLDPIQVKAVFFALCFGEDALSQADAEAFAACFYETETRVREETGETYEVAVPLPMEEVYAQLSAWRGRAVTAEERSNAMKIYSIVMGSAGSGTFNGVYEPGGNAPMELEASMFTDPLTKNSADLAIYAANAWNSGWGYVWGTFGQVLTPELLQYKISQYPEGVGDEADFIRSHWLNRRTTDCVGLIKGYGWLNTETMEIQYGSNGMPDVGADGMYYNAGRKGSIETMPDTPGLAVWKSGHIGVYIGNGEVIEAMDTRYGVVKQSSRAGAGPTGWRCRGSSMTKEELKLESKNITIGFDAAKLDALEFVLRKQRSSVQRRMEEVLQQLYESEVPEAVREYVDSKSTPAARPRRPAKSSVTKQKEGDEHGTAFLRWPQ